MEEMKHINEVTPGLLENIECFDKLGSDTQSTATIDENLKVGDSLDASSITLDEDLDLEPDSQTNVIEEEEEKNEEEQGLKGILKQKGQYSESKHVNFNSEVDWIPYDEEKDFAVEIQIVKEFPKKIVSYRELFRKMAEEERAKKLQEEESSDEDSEEEAPQTSKFGKLSLLEPGMHRHQEKVPEQDIKKKAAQQPEKKEAPGKCEFGKQPQNSDSEINEQCPLSCSSDSIYEEDLNKDHCSHLEIRSCLTQDESPAENVQDRFGNRSSFSSNSRLCCVKQPTAKGLDENNVQNPSNVCHCQLAECIKESIVETPKNPNQEIHHSTSALKHPHSVDVNMVENINYDDILREQKVHSNLEIITEETEAENMCDEVNRAKIGKNLKAVPLCFLCDRDSESLSVNGFTSKNAAQVKPVTDGTYNAPNKSKPSPPLITISKPEGSLSNDLLDGAFELSDGSEYSDDLTESTDVLDYSASVESTDVESPSELELNNNSLEELRLSP